MNKKVIWWKVELVLNNKKNKKKKLFSLDIRSTEKWADNILNALIFIFEEKGFTVGGGIWRVFDCE